MQVLRTNINKRYSKSLKIPCRLCSQGSDTRWWQLSNYTTWEVFYPASNAEDGVPRILSFLSQEEFLTSILGYFLKNLVFPCYFVLNLTNKKNKKNKKIMEGTKYIYIPISRSMHFYSWHFRNLSDGPCYRGQSTQLTELLNIHTFKALGVHFTFLQPDPKASSEKRLKWTPSVGYVVTTKWKMCWTAI